MKVIPEPLTFEWDKGNKDKNLLKHLVTNQEAEEVFTNNPFILAEDERHSHLEKRFQALGQTNVHRTLFLSFAVRRDKVRIISIRDMNRKERVIYAKAKKTS